MQTLQHWSKATILVCKQSCWRQRPAFPNHYHFIIGKKRTLLLQKTITVQFGDGAITPPDGWGKRGWEDGREGEAWVQTQPCLWNGNNRCGLTIGCGGTSKYASPQSVQTDATREDEAVPVWQNMPVLCQPGGSVRCKHTPGVHSTSLPKQTIVWVSTVCVAHLGVLLAIYR